jgi:ferredoxin
MSIAMICNNPVDLMVWEINREKCLRCGACVSVCPELALELKEDSGITHNARKCTLCGICAKVCPISAIGVEK